MVLIGFRFSQPIRGKGSAGAFGRDRCNRNDRGSLKQKKELPRVRRLARTLFERASLTLSLKLELACLSYARAGPAFALRGDRGLALSGVQLGRDGGRACALGSRG